MTSPISPKVPTLIVALDFPDPRPALELRERLDGLVDFFKVGKELFTVTGPQIVEALSRSGARVFLDLKFHDIPTTVGRAVAAASRLGVDLVDVHASGGAAMMSAAAESARQESRGGHRTEVFAVTVLTHLADADLRSIGVAGGSREQVLRLARLAHESGLDGVVASAHEVAAIREATGDELAVLVPGVRPQWASQAHDQARIATPGEAARAGARYIVVGRAITTQADPRAAASRILDELETA
ncbi:MAG TPA: orotidine-5'-phosphate decarboxylase [Vicinamibacteria bacterium]|jgi:orotidine-5'-phosphate decarboxylase